MSGRAPTRIGPATPDPPAGPPVAACVIAAGLAAAGLLTGCGTPNQRVIRVTSDPPGARVWLNDTEIGVTPAEAAFRFHGVYDVRLRLEGYEPVREGRQTPAPVWEWPGLDLVAYALPGAFRNMVEWHFELEPAKERTMSRRELDRDLLDNALGLRARAENPDDR